MNHEHLIQCKRVIMYNKKSDRFVSLTLADKMYLIRLTKRLKKEGNINNLSFEEFALLCKHHKKSSMIKLESNYSTSFINILQFDMHTLHSAMYKIINEIELYNDEDKYDNIEDIISLLRINNVLLFNTFNELCDKLNVKVSIE